MQVLKFRVDFGRIDAHYPSYSCRFYFNVSCFPISDSGKSSHRSPGSSNRGMNKERRFSNIPILIQKSFQTVSAYSGKLLPLREETVSNNCKYPYYLERFVLFVLNLFETWHLFTFFLILLDVYLCEVISIPPRLFCVK